MFHLDTISASEKNSDDNYTLIRGELNPELRGFIYNTSENRLVSRSFGKCEEYNVTKDNVHSVMETFYQNYENVKIHLVMRVH